MEVEERLGPEAGDRGGASPYDIHINCCLASLLVHTNKLQEPWLHAIEYGLQKARAANYFSKFS